MDEVRAPVKPSVAAKSRYQETPIVYVDNIDKNIDSKQLYSIFKVYGTVTKCVIFRNEEGKSKGCGTIHFKTADEARSCIRNSYRTPIGGQRLEVRQLTSEEIEKKNLEENQNNFTKLHVDNLPLSYDEGKLRELFKIYGIVIGCKIIRNQYGISKGFGFVEFKYPEVAAAAIQRMNGMVLENDQAIYVARYKTHAEREIEKSEMRRRQKCTICIRNLDSDITKDGLESAFSRFGNVTFSKIIIYTDRHKAFGLLTYSSQQEAQLAVEGMNGTTIKKNKIYVSLSNREEQEYKDCEDEYLPGTNTNVKPQNQYRPMSQEPNLHQLPLSQSYFPHLGMPQLVPRIPAMRQLPVTPPLARSRPTKALKKH